MGFFASPHPNAERDILSRILGGKPANARIFVLNRHKFDAN
jgi:hypothetical protein